MSHLEVQMQQKNTQLTTIIDILWIKHFLVILKQIQSVSYYLSKSNKKMGTLPRFLILVECLSISLMMMIDIRCNPRKKKIVGAMLANTFAAKINRVRQLHGIRGDCEELNCCCWVLLWEKWTIGHRGLYHLWITVHYYCFIVPLGHKRIKLYFSSL